MSTTVYECPSVLSLGQEVVHVPRERYVEVVQSLKDEGFNMCIDVTAVDYIAAPDARSRFSEGIPDGVKPERFEVVVNLLSFKQHRRIRLRVQIPANDPTVASLFHLYPGSDAMEREAYDMFGIRFEGHPDLSRILMPEDWEGHPLRKDFSQGRIPVQFKYTEQPYDTSRSASEPVRSASEPVRGEKS